MEISVFTICIQHRANMVNFHINMKQQESCTIQNVNILKINLARIHFTYIIVCILFFKYIEQKQRGGQQQTADFNSEGQNCVEFSALK